MFFVVTFYAKETTRDNTDEITCPHCDYEYSDSWECIPTGDGELSWSEECMECKKDFDVYFDGRNTDNGYTSKVQECEDGNHNFEIVDEFFDRGDYTRGISRFARVERCVICDKYELSELYEMGEI